jgi:hypothetical protein
MSEFQKQIDEAREFINDTQEVIERLNDTLLALNQLMKKQESKNQRSSISLATREAFEKDLQALVKRHLNLDPASENLVLPSQAALSDTPKPASKRPGKYRSLV